MPSGYRDVKVNPVVNEHLCEIQLQLRDFFTLKNGQHTVYTWAREFKVSTEILAQHLFENTSHDVLEEMLHLARQNWHGMRYCLPDLQVAAGQYDLVEKGLRQVIRFDQSSLGRTLQLPTFSVYGTTPSIAVCVHLQLCVIAAGPGCHPCVRFVLRKCTRNSRRRRTSYGVLRITVARNGEGHCSA